MKKLFFDIETTGLDNKLNGIHQLAGCVEVDGEVKEYFNFKVAPHSKDVIDAEALKVSGVTKEQVLAYPKCEDIYNKFITILDKYCDRYNKKDKFFLVGYNNASFDNQFLRSWFLKNGDTYFGSWFWSNTLDVMVLATQKLLEKRVEMENFKLKTVASTFGITIDEQRLHDAQYDIDLTRYIYYKSIDAI